MTRRRLLLVALLQAPLAQAWEADVHYGLTRWLALRAGFGESQAEAIAIGDQRQDGGLVQTLLLAPEYACGFTQSTQATQADAAKLAQHAHYPAATRVPAPPGSRVVQAGDAAARADLEQLEPVSRGKEGAMLGKLGEALHPLQDSWSHQGEPSTPRWNGLACDPLLISAHAAARGGWASHAADLTHRWPEDTLAMAEASYQAMLRYGRVEGVARTPAPWVDLVEPVRRFASAASKSDKRAWFLAQSMGDTRFLQGISLPDGRDPGPLAWPWRQLPPPPGEASMQHEAPQEARSFFDRLLARWLGGEPLPRLLAEMGPADAAARAQLAARMKLWRQRDHGAVADLAHAAGPFSAAQLKAVDRLARDIPASTASVALLPLQPSTPEPAPMLPYVLKTLPEVAGRPRLLAVARLRHAPYDSVGWVAEQQGEGWRLVDMVAMVDP